MKLLLDDMHAPSIAEVLSRESYDVTAVASMADLRGRSDRDLLTYASTEGRVVVTENVVDFALLVSEWTVESRLFPGLIYTNPKRFNRATLAYPSNLIDALRTFLEHPPREGQSWIWWL